MQEMALSAEELRIKLERIVRLSVEDIQAGNTPPLHSLFQEVTGVSIAMFDSPKVIAEVVPNAMEGFDPVFYGPDYIPFKKALVQFTSHKILGSAYPESTSARVVLESTPGSPWFIVPKQASSIYALAEFERSDNGTKAIVEAKKTIKNFAFPMLPDFDELSADLISDWLGKIFPLMQAVHAADASFNRFRAVVLLSQLVKSQPRAALWLKGRIESAQSNEPFHSPDAANFYFEDLLETYLDEMTSTSAERHSLLVKHAQFPAVRSLLNSVKWDVDQLKRQLTGEAETSHKWVNLLRAAKTNAKLTIESFDCLRKIIVLRIFPKDAGGKQTSFLEFLSSRINE